MLAALSLVVLSGTRFQTPTAPPPIDRSPRLRRTLPNGASVGAERRPNERRTVFQAVLSNPGGDRESEYGERHLLEHLVAAREPDLDRRLETVGGGMGAATGRESMRFWVSVPPEEFGLGLEVLRSLLKPIALRAEDVARERTILAREVGLLTAEERAGISAWMTLYGDSGRDPVGVSASFVNATPEALERRWRGLLAGPRLSLFVAGPIELDSSVERLERIARTFPDGSHEDWAPRAEAARSAASSGSFAVAVGPSDERATLAALAVGLALASEVEGSALTYTLSPRNGAILLTNPDDRASLGKIVRRGDTGLRNRALNLVRAWFAERLDDAAGSSEMRATLSAYRAGLTPERLLAVLAEVRVADLDAAFARWQEAAR